MTRSALLPIPTPLLASLLAAAMLPGCVCPPCPGTADTAPLEVGARMVLWNGDGDGIGSAAKGWESCDAKPCKAKFRAPVEGEGRDGSNAIQFEAEGPQFIGGGWNLYGWWPADAGIDISRYDTVEFWLRVEAESQDLAPTELNTALGGSGENDSAFLAISKYDKNFADGEWHLIAIPLAEFQTGDGKNFNPQSVWEFRLNTWNATPKKFFAYVDELAVVKMGQ